MGGADPANPGDDGRPVSVLGDRGAGAAAHVGVRRLAGVAELTSLVEVRAAAKDWPRFSSRIIGDPDVRDYPQLPLEVDTPEHGIYRTLLDPILGRRAVAALEPRVRSIARGLVAGFAQRGRADAVRDLAVHMVATTIAHAFGREQDAAELTSWGITSWEVRADGTRSAARLDAYVARVLDDGASTRAMMRSRDSPPRPSPDGRLPASSRSGSRTSSSPRAVTR